MYIDTSSEPLSQIMSLIRNLIPEDESPYARFPGVHLVLLLFVRTWGVAEAVSSTVYIIVYDAGTK
jgi:hypothetical protein